MTPCDPDAFANRPCRFAAPPPAADPGEAAVRAFRAYADALAAFHAEPADPDKANAVRAAYRAFLVVSDDIPTSVAADLAAKHDSRVARLHVMARCRKAA